MLKKKLKIILGFKLVGMVDIVGVDQLQIQILFNNY